ncbi:MAG TPA: hypothetical protein VES40_13740 [Ilumatobacteraceae bacterium]|nr:hypothetical protein [Ilumatobacteraceae bacterium]
MDLTAEERRLREARAGTPWRRWGPYLSERQWGTVREDYSDSGDAWSYFSHDQSRSRAYRWGEDGLAGISDTQQRMCFAIALWNENDPILKERLFGLTNTEGNHGEDVKEYYFYLDNLPTHSYQRWLYKYPHQAYPYDNLVATNRSRSRTEAEYELIDTGIFDDDRYFDVEVEYAKDGPDDILCRITIHNRGADAAPLHVLPTLWFRNTWSWNDTTSSSKPQLSTVAADHPVVQADHDELGRYFLHAEADATLLFCENESNHIRLGTGANLTAYVKDGVNDHVVNGLTGATNPAGTGTKVAAHTRVVVPGGGASVLRVRLTDRPIDELPQPFADFDAIIDARRGDADEFYESITPPALTADESSVMRQALAGMLWSKQTYNFDVDTWLRERDSHPLRSPTRHGTRNESWFHMQNHDVISMPDKWEYPWYAAWDLAFHTIPLMMVDPDFAKGQLDLMLSPAYLHPSGQIPAYEWNFSDVNPPVHAFATLLVHNLDFELSGDDDIDRAFLRESFHKLLLNFTWWVNRKDPSGRSVFEGGFLGLDNIGVFDRSAALPTGGRLEQADGTAWMALYSQNMLDLSLILAERDPTYEDFILKFLLRFFWIAAAMDPVGEHPDEMWDEEDGFFYDVLRLPDGTGQRLEVRSLVGLLPLCATTVFEAETLAKFPSLRPAVEDHLRRNGDLLARIADPLKPGVNGRHILSLVNEEKLRRILARMLDEERFLGPHGIRSLSKWHLEHPYEIDVAGTTYKVQYEPAESTSGMFGGNSNWRGPVWFPVNVLIIRALLQHYQYYGDEFTIECPTGSGNQMTLFEVAKEISDRLASTFLTDESGRRPVYGGTEKFQTDEHWRDLVLFYEYFHGDNGAGLGASHQTGWTGVVARLIQLFGELDAEDVLRLGGRPLARPYRRLTDERIGDVTMARRTRGVTP